MLVLGIAFNPILVWFYLEVFDVTNHYARILSIPFWSDFIRKPAFIISTCSYSFNPILVWFYLEYFWTLSVAPLYFQSHSGLILSVRLARESHPRESTFNPILVWFYLVLGEIRRYVDSRLSIPFWSDFISTQKAISKRARKSFQSHSGLILSKSYWVFESKSSLPFNPILVWFYHLWPSNSLCSSCLLSIPFWSDFIEKIKNKDVANGYAFNPILVWFYQYLKKCLKLKSGFLSIPFWSDFILNTYSGGRFEIGYNFQSHSGLILSEHKK